MKATKDGGNSAKSDFSDIITRARDFFYENIFAVSENSYICSS